jgi:surface protein
MFGRTVFNQDISSWDVSSVVNMASMFQDATGFNKDISSWDVSSVTTMFRMFLRSTAFNQDLSTWSVNPNVSVCGSFATDATSWTQPKPNFTNCTP